MTRGQFPTLLDFDFDILVLVAGRHTISHLYLGDKVYQY
jgi:hypothetical protein